MNENPLAILLQQLMQQAGPRGATFAGRVIEPGTQPDLRTLMTRPPTESPDAEGMGGLGTLMGGAGIARQVTRVPGSADGKVFGSVQGIKGYQLIDNKTGQVLKEYGPSQRNIARGRADRLDNAYGAIRYTVKPLFE